jgi:dienelactone hydrolase
MTHASRWWAAVIATMLVASLSVGSAESHFDMASTRSPFPDAGAGPYAVGHRVLVVPAHGGAPELHVDVWYPAVRSAKPTASYSLLPGIDFPARLARAGARPAPGSFPLVLYSHGSGAFAHIATFFTEVVASNGYVVVATNHPGDTIIDAYLRQLTGESLDIAAAIDLRVGDLRRIITAITRRRADPRTPFLRFVDVDHVVASGHSLGGAGAIALAAADRRVDAVIAMDATWGFISADRLAAVHVPVLLLWAHAGTFAGSQELDTLNRPGYRVTLPRAVHESFTDVCSYAALAPAWSAALPAVPIGSYFQGVYDTTCVPPVMRARRVHDLVDGYSLTFLDVVLGGRRPFWQLQMLRRAPCPVVDPGSAAPGAPRTIECSVTR